jgi:hypothetical protein
MVSFTPEGIRYSSELYESPKDRWWWYLDGHARVRTPTGTTRKMSTVVAYRYNGEWFFTPPNIDREWESSHVSDEERAADYSADITVDLDPGCPVDVRGLKVRMEKSAPQQRVASFSLANRTARAIQGYTLGLGVLGEACFGITAGIPSLIQPGEVSSGEKPLEYSAYSYWCEERLPRRLVIDSVFFVDGTEWKDPRLMTEEYQRQCDGDE